MPPKRAASGSGASTTSSSSKKAKTSSQTSTQTDEPPRSLRWSAVSGSANADADYKTTWKNPQKFYSYVTICPPVADEDDEDGELDDEVKDEDDEDSEGSKCGKKGCICFKPISENPEHPWIISQAGYRKYITQHIHFSLRDPDNFNMYTFNDHAGYGCLEVVQNLFLDYVESAERGWMEQWAVCEGFALWLMNPNSACLYMIDDGECVKDTIHLVGYMFLDMLAQLDSQDLVGDATEVRSLGTVMAMYLQIAHNSRDASALPPLNRKGKSQKKFQPDYFDDAILAYANQRGVTLQGPDNIDALTAKLDGDVKLPKKGAKTPWGWKAALKRYEKQYDGLTGMMGQKQTDGIGGDALDVTTWTSARRKEANFKGKDPLGKRELDAIKKGMVIQVR